MIGGDWHPSSEPDDYDAAADRAMHWAGLIHQITLETDGFGFVCAAIESFAARVMQEEPNGPWAKYAALFLDEDETVQ